MLRQVWKGVDDAVLGDNRNRFNWLCASIVVSGCCMVVVSDVLLTTAVWSGRQPRELGPIGFARSSNS